MSEFQFSLDQVVSLPGIEIGGRVSSRQESINRPNEYHVHYLLPDLQVGEAVIEETVLLEAQPKKDEGISIAVKVDEAGLDSALGKARELNALVGRASRTLGPRKSKARKSKTRIRR